MKSKTHNSRLIAISGALVLIVVVIISRLFFVQVLHGNAYDEKADQKFISPSADIFDRGKIYFTKKDDQRIDAATVMEGYKLIIHPNQMTDIKKIAENISNVISLDQDDFLNKASKKSDTYEEISSRISREDALKIQSYKDKGVEVVKEKYRFYPGDSLASHTLGLVAYKGDTLAGRYGLERYYEDVLSRQKENLNVNFFAEVFSNISDTFFEGDTKEGDIVTTIEPQVQQYLEKELEKIMQKWSSDSAGAIVMNPKDGSIYAMASTPNFDVNNFGKVEDIKILSNPLVENVYEFGSVIKPLVMASALDMGVVTPNTTYYDDKGYVMVSGKKLNNFDKKGRGTATMQDVLNQSLNTGMVFIEQKMGKENFRKYMLSYGIGEKTGIDLPNETSGLVSNLQSHGEVEYATAAFGQGIAMTPVEAIRAFGALANDGVMVTPHVMKSIIYDMGGTDEYKTTNISTALKPETSITISRMLATIVDKALGEGKYKLEHYSIAAKTGTAQIPLPSGKGYYTDRNLHSLFGYYPAYDPKFVVIFFTQNTKGIGADFAATTLADPFMNTAKFLLTYYEVPPDR